MQTDRRELSVYKTSVSLKKPCFLARNVVVNFYRLNWQLLSLSTGSAAPSVARELRAQTIQLKVASIRLHSTYVSIAISAPNFRYFKISMLGPEGTPYENGTYNLELFLPEGIHNINKKNISLKKRKKKCSCI